jgi:hypothetical protein
MPLACVSLAENPDNAFPLAQEIDPSKPHYWVKSLRKAG